MNERTKNDTSPAKMPLLSEDQVVALVENVVANRGGITLSFREGQILTDWAYGAAITTALFLLAMRGDLVLEVGDDRMDFRMHDSLESLGRTVDVPEALTNKIKETIRALPVRLQS